MLDLLSGLIGAALIVFGIYAIIATTAITDMTALVPEGATGLNEARAIYAGSFWAMGALILYALWTPRARQALLRAVGIIFIGFVIARFISIAMDGFDPILVGPIVSEIIVALVLLLASRSPRSV